MLAAAIFLANGLVYSDVQTIVDARCAGPCHNQNGAAFFVPFESFPEIKGNEDAMVRMITSDLMPQGEPPGFKSSPDGLKLLDWLRTGTDLHPRPGDQCPEQPPPPILMRDPRTLTYADVKPLLDRYCVGCHNPTGRMPRKPFTTLDGIRRHAGDAWERLDEGAMPLGDPEFRFTPEGRTLLGWLRYSPDLNAPSPGEDDGATGEED